MECLGAITQWGIVVLYPQNSFVIPYTKSKGDKATGRNFSFLQYPYIIDLYPPPEPCFHLW